MKHSASVISEPKSFNEVFRDEVCAVRPGSLSDFAAAPQSADKSVRATNLQSLYAAIGKLEEDSKLGLEDRRGLSALCFSGGGIRSATFNLGVIQGLARKGLLSRFDYLSSVSGGGYIAGWLRAWMHRDGVDEVERKLAGTELPPNPLAPEPNPVDRLREYSNYLTPHLGLLSPDTWSAAAILIRNLVLNWLVILPLLGLITVVPQFVLLVVLNHQFDNQIAMPMMWLALFVAIAGSASTHWLRRFGKYQKLTQGFFVMACVVPTCAAAALLSTAVLGMDLPWHHVGQVASDIEEAQLWQFCLLWCVVIPLLGWLPSELRLWFKQHTVEEKIASPIFEFAGLVISGLVAALLLVMATHLLLPILFNHPVLYVIFAMPTLLAIYLLSRMLFVAFASLSESGRGAPRRDASDDADREWWARLSGWVLMAAVGWTVAAGVCLLGGQFLMMLESRFATHVTVVMGGASGLAAALLQRGGNSSAAHSEAPGKRSTLRDILFAIAAPLFALCVFLLIARGTALLGDWLLHTKDILKMPADLHREENALPMTTSLQFLIVPLLLALFALAMGRVVNVNRFSLHGVYRNRLVRAYLGASDEDRKPDPFSGFATTDDLPLHMLGSRAASPRPLSLINTTLNLVKSGDKLAWQQRKAESFSMSPLYCGNFHEGYRPSKEYGGNEGISLGTAVAISGAAANPNMGSSSSPTIGFLLALFNVRLGAWLGNTNRHGNSTYRLPSPRLAAFPLLAELFGQTTSESSYVNLSDGGHFDNLGLYEVVLRRCRYIVVSDAGQDPKFGFGDLGNAIRKIRIDFGIPIDFDQAIDILPRSGKPGGLYCATGRVRYSAVDGADAPDGILIYLKPTLRARGRPIPYDVYSYAESVALFPHESTADQWFSESQFESYRALGAHAIDGISSGGTFTSLADLIEWTARYVGAAQSESPDTAEATSVKAELPTT